MKTMKTILGILFFFLICTTIGHTQNMSLRNRGYWTLGLNGGWAYQTSDVESDFKGYGLGMTLAKNLYYRPNHLFTFDARGRFLFANMYGLDGKKQTGILNNSVLNGTQALDYTPLGYVYQNYNTKLGELALEGVIGFNRMRENHRWELSLYGGLGLDVYQTKIDQYDGINQKTYEDAYKNLEGKSNIKSTLKNNILDQDYETLADGQSNLSAQFMPSIGFDLNYWFTPRFALGVGHRMTFSQTDDIDGAQWASDNSKTLSNDIYHYTNIGARWILGAAKEKLPEITYTTPDENPYYSNNSKVDIRAKILHVSNPNNVECQFNNQNVRFDYFGGNLSTYVRLQPGRNEFSTTATNKAGSVTETQVIYYETNKKEHTPPHHNPPKKEYDDDQPEILETVDAPTIRFRNPNRDYQKVKRSDFDLKISVKGVTSRRNVTLLIDDRKVTNFSFRNNTITKSITLSKETTKIMVIAKNEGGTAEKVRHIVLEKRIIHGNPHTDPNTHPVNRSLPTVYITSPSTTPFETHRTSYTIKADIENIDRKNDITFIFNGKRQSRFDYDARNKEFSGKVILRNGKNTIIIQARNNYGKADDLVEIIFKKLNAPSLKKPVVHITSTSKPTQDCRSTIKADIENVISKRDIQFTVNGKTIHQFDFNTRTQKFSTTIDLNEGRNTIVITATNKAGKDKDQTNISCQTQKGEKPTIVIHSPKHRATTDAPSTKLDATIEYIQSSRDIQLSLNNRSIRDFSYNGKSKRLVAFLDLKDGINTIKIIATNSFGTATKSTSVTFKKIQKGEKPSITIYTPKNNSTTKSSSAKLTASISHVDKKDNITVTINNQKVRNFVFNRISGKLNANVTLDQGRNIIKIVAQNNFGSANKTTVVTYKKIQVKILPRVTIQTPKNNSNSSKLSTNVKAIVENALKRQISLLVNGNNQYFTFKGNILTANVKLKSGKNTIKVVAKTRDGNASDEVSVNYKSKVLILAKPIIKDITPNSRTKGLKKRENLTATIMNIRSSKDITVEVNGRTIKGVTYNGRTKKMSVPIMLSNGETKIIITAKNNSGTATKSVKLYLKKIVIGGQTINKPTVTFNSVSQPTSNPYNPDVLISAVTATIKGVSRKSDITLKANGKVVKKFEYSMTSNKLHASINVIKGKNKIQIIAKNKGGTTTVEHSFEY